MTRPWLTRPLQLLIALTVPIALLLSLLPVSGSSAAPLDPSKAQIRVVHAVPDFGAVDVYVNQTLVLQNVTFFTVSDYLEINPGVNWIQVIPAGESIANPSLFVVNSHLTFAANRTYSVIARGSVPLNNVGGTLIEDSNIAPAVGQARVRAAHFSPDAPAVDVYVNGAKTISNLNFLSASDYLSVPAGTYTLGIAPAGGAVIYTTNATIAAGQVLTIWANGLLNGNGAQAFKLTPSLDASYSTTFRLRATHAIPDLAGSPVDVYANGTKILTFDFFTVSDYLTLYAGTYDLRVVPQGGDPATQAAIQASVTFTAGKDYSVVARGTAGTFAASVLEDTNTAPAVGQARVRAAHFSPDAPAVDVYVNGAKTISNLNFLSASDYLSVPAGTYTLGIAPAGGAVIYTTNATIAAGQVLTIWANGLLNGNGAQAFKLTPSLDASYSTTFRLRATHAIPDLAGSPVDVYANGTKILTFDFFTVSDYLTLYAGTYDLRVVPQGGDPATQAAIQASVTFTAGKDYSVVARGTGGTFAATVLEDTNTAPAVGQARVRAAHFSPDAPAVDVYVNGAKTISNLNFLSASDYLSVPAGTYTLGIAPAGGAVIYTTTVTINANKVLTIWANGLLSGNGPRVFKLSTSIDADYSSGRFTVFLPSIGQ